MIGIYIDNSDKQARYVFEMIFNRLGYPFVFVNENNTNKITIPIYYQNYEINNSHAGNNAIYINKYNGISSEVKVYFNNEPFTVKYISKNISDISKIVELDDLITKHDSKYIFNFDIVKNIFYYVSCEQEGKIKKRDNHGRFLAEYNINTIDIPVVDILINLIYSVIKDSLLKFNIPILKKSMWPGNKDFAVFLSHDVDRIYEHEKYNLLSHAKKNILYLFKLNFKSALREFSYILRVLTIRANGFNDFDKIMDMELKCGGTSSFYFIGDKKRTRYGARYDIKKIGLIVDGILKNGFDIGMHGGYDSFNNLEGINNEKEVINSLCNKKVIGNRNHYLRFKMQNTWKNLQQADFKYDSTLGFSDCIGYRAGTGFPYHPYDTNNNCGYSIIELPLIVMDGALFEHGKLSNDEIVLKVKKMIDTTFELKSCISLLWHVSVTEEFNFPGWGKVYSELLKYISGKYNSYIASGEKIYEWWISRENLQVIDFNKKHDCYEYTYYYSGKYDTKIAFEVNNTKFNISNANWTKIGENIIEINLQSNTSFIVKFSI